MEKKGFFGAGIFILALLFCLQMVLAVDTQLDIENSPPFLKQMIPNQSWAGGDLLNVFDLDDYFGSATNATLDYSFSAVENVSVTINNVNSSSMVSFYPDESFSGIRELFFYASDGTMNASSNKVYLFIAQDYEPPQWGLIEKNKGVIYQSDSVSFSANWTDNFALKNYTLSINQGSGYSQYNGGFSGTANISTQSVQISAAAGQIVYWFFCARDTSHNSNCTDIKDFTVSTRVLPPSTPNAEEEEEEESAIKKVITAVKKEIKDFSLSVSSFLVSLRQGSAQTKILEITNTGNIDLNFDLKINGLEDFAVLGQDTLLVSPGETRKVTIDFFSKKDTIPGEYFGEVVVSSVSNVSIPIILEVNPVESDADVFVNVLPDYKSVRPGGVVVANISLKNLKDPIEGGVDLYYSIIDFYGNTYDSSIEKVPLTSSVTLMRNLTTSEDMPLGGYLFHARVSHEDSLLSTASDTFEVGVRFRFLAFIKSTSVFLLIILLSLFSILFVLRYKSLEKRKENLNLYVQALELKKLIAMQKFDEAVSLFIKMKNDYGEPVTKEMLEDKEALKAQMKILADKFDLNEEPKPAAKPEEKTNEGKKSSSLEKSPGKKVSPSETSKQKSTDNKEVKKK